MAPVAVEISSSSRVGLPMKTAIDAEIQTRRRNGAWQPEIKTIHSEKNKRDHSIS